MLLFSQKRLLVCLASEIDLSIWVRNFGCEVGPKQGPCHNKTTSKHVLSISHTNKSGLRDFMKVYR